MTLRVLTPFALGYFLTYLLRAVNAVVAPDLVAEIGLSAAELGLLTAAYLGAFALFQLPLGVLLDRYGPRRVQAALFGVAALGCLLFAFGRDALALTAARALIGLGFSGGLMSGFKAIVLWVSPPRRALANACVMSFGALGLLMSTAPTELAAQTIGWRVLFIILAARDAGRGADHPGRRAGAEAPACGRVPPATGAPAHRHLQGPGIPGHRPAAGDHGRDPHRHPNPVGGPLVSRCRGLRSARRCQPPARHGRGIPGRHPRQRRHRRLVRAPGRQRARRHDGISRRLHDRAARHRAGDHLLHAGLLARLRHERAAGGPGLSVAIEPLRRRPVGAGQHGHEPLALPGRLRHPIRHRRHHRHVPAERVGGIRSELLPGGVRRLPRPADRDLRDLHRQPKALPADPSSDAGKA